MTVKQRLAEIFQAHQGEFLSGTYLAAEIGVSRTAVWKAILALREDGFPIVAEHHHGYQLEMTADILDRGRIEKALGTSAPFYRLSVHRCVTSTNNLVRQKATEGASEGTVVISGKQTEGRGRRGKSFYSPSESGLYLSILVRPSFSAEKANLITCAAAVAVCRAIDSVTATKDASIKWVNDVFVDQRKVCGILTEGAMDIESGTLDYAVVGIGINAYPLPEDAPEVIRALAGSIFPARQADGRNKLAAEVLREFRSLYANLERADFVDEYKERSFIPGCDIEVWRGDKHSPAYAESINDDLTLTVRYTDGTTERLNSGEVSVRKSGWHR